MSFTPPALNELIERSHVVSIPLRHKFRGLEHREVMLFEGDRSPAEWAAFTDYDDDEAAWWLFSAIEQGFSPDLPSIPGGVEDVRVNAIVPALELPDVTAVLKKFSGVTSVKVKVGEPGHTTIDDVGRLAKVRSVVGPDVAIRLDANGAWEVAEAERNLFMLAAFGVDYIEQPVASIDDMCRLRDRLAGTGIRIAADETLRRGRHLDEILDRQAADLLILKVNPLGGIRKCLTIAHAARARGIDVVVSSGLETSVGIAHGAHLHTLLANPEREAYDAGLGSLVLFTGDVVTQPLTPTNGAIPVTLPVLDPRKLRKFRAGDERTTWWHERLRRVYDRIETLVAQ